MTAPATSVKQGGVWKPVLAMSIKQGGTWKTVTGAWVKNAGVWKKFYAAIAAISNSGVAFGDGFVPPPTNAATGSLTFQSDGSITRAGSPVDGSYGTTAWLNAIGAGNGAAFWVRATVNSGSVTTGSTGVWLQMNVARTWTKSATTGASNCQLSIDIATDAAGSNIVSAGNLWTLQYSHTQ